MDNEIDVGTVRAIEAIVMVAVEPVPPDLLAQLLEQPTALIDRVCAQLSAAYDEAGHGFQLVRVAGGYRYQSHAELAPYVERFLLDGQRARMSAAALETLAIVAYKQPLSRAQIAAIRGVDPDGVLRTLQARGYVSEIGRDSGPGQAILYGTTPSFLERLGLASIHDQRHPRRADGAGDGAGRAAGVLRRPAGPRLRGPAALDQRRRAGQPAVAPVARGRQGVPRGGRRRRRQRREHPQVARGRRARR